jgi:DNA-binding transcriptional ArsR family regulator
MNDSIRLARILKVLSVPARVRIVQLLKGRALCVNALTARLGITQGAVSQHLRIMRDAGLVVDEKRGYFVHYRLNEQVLAGWQEHIGNLLDPENGSGENTKGAGTCAAAMKKATDARNRKT